MADINTSAYQSICDFVQANWQHIELRDGAGTAILRISTSDSRVSWTHTAGSQTLELTIVVKGADSGITLPQTFASSTETWRPHHNARQSIIFALTCL